MRYIAVAGGLHFLQGRLALSAPRIKSPSGGGGDGENEGRSAWEEESNSQRHRRGKFLQR